MMIRVRGWWCGLQQLLVAVVLVFSVAMCSVKSESFVDDPRLAADGGEAGVELHEYEGDAVAASESSFESSLPPPQQKATSGDYELVRSVLEHVHETLLGKTNGATIETMLSQHDVLPPSSVTCAVVDGEGGYEEIFSKTYGSFADEAGHAGIGIRSISKTFMSLSTMRLIEMLGAEDKSAYHAALERLRHYTNSNAFTTEGLRLMMGAQGANDASSNDSTTPQAFANDNLAQRGTAFTMETTLGDFFPEACGASVLASATLRDMLKLTTNLDNRLNAMWRMARGLNDHAGFPSYCDEHHMNPMECVERVICPAYTSKKVDDAERDGVGGSDNTVPRAQVTIGTVPSSMALAASTATLHDCIDRHKDCRYLVEEGGCEERPRSSEYWCQKSCGFCLDHATSLEITASGFSTDAAEVMKEPFVKLHAGSQLQDELLRFRVNRGAWDVYKKDPATASDDDEDNDDDDGGGAERFHFDSWDDHFSAVGTVTSDELRYGYSNGCLYDNYSYTLLDAIVMRATGNSISAWVLVLLAEPLELNDMIRCLNPSEDDYLANETNKFNERLVRGCYAPLTTPEEQIDQMNGEPWPHWSGGVESVSWPSTTLFSSSADLAKFMGFILNRGLIKRTEIAEDGSVVEKTVRLMPAESFEMMLSPVGKNEQNANRQRTNCQGAETFSIGIGICMEKDTFEDRHMCMAESYFLWGSTYGSRMLGLDIDMNLGLEKTHPFAGITCGTTISITTAYFEGQNGEAIRIAERQHRFAHSQAAGIRDAFPKPDS